MNFIFLFQLKLFLPKLYPQSIQMSFNISLLNLVGQLDNGSIFRNKDNEIQIFLLQVYLIEWIGGRKVCIFKRPSNDLILKETIENCFIKFEIYLCKWTFGILED